MFETIRHTHSWLLSSGPLFCYGRSLRNLWERPETRHVLKNSAAGSRMLSQVLLYSSLGSSLRVGLRGYKPCLAGRAENCGSMCSLYVSQTIWKEHSLLLPFKQICFPSLWLLGCGVELGLGEGRWAMVGHWSFEQRMQVAFVCADFLCFTKIFLLIHMANL